MTAPGWLTARPIAHRGLHDRAAGRIENSFGAADAAVEAGFAIECDVQLSADGEAMVFHDFALDRLTAAGGPIRERRAADLSALPLRGSRDTIPTLPAFLARVADRAPVIVEIKSRFDGDLALTRRVVAILSALPCRVAVKSFDPGVVAAVRQLAPSLPRGVVAQSRYDEPEWAGLDAETLHGLANLLHFEETEPDFLSWRVGDLPAGPPYLCRRLGRLPVITWTVRNDADHGRAAAHADQIVFEGFVPAG